MIYALLKKPSKTIEYHTDGHGTFKIKLDINGKNVPRLDGEKTSVTINPKLTFEFNFPTILPNQTA